MSHDDDDNGGNGDGALPPLQTQCPVAWLCLRGIRDLDRLTAYLPATLRALAQCTDATHTTHGHAWTLCEILEVGCELGNLPILRAAFRFHSAVLTAPDYAWTSLLSSAIASGRVDAVRYLVSQGVGFSPRLIVTLAYNPAALEAVRETWAADGARPYPPIDVLTSDTMRRPNRWKGLERVLAAGMLEPDVRLLWELFQPSPPDVYLGPYGHCEDWWALVARLVAAVPLVPLAGVRGAPSPAVVTERTVRMLCASRDELGGGWRIPPTAWPLVLDALNVLSGAAEPWPGRALSELRAAAQERVRIRGIVEAARALAWLKRAALVALRAACRASASTSTSPDD